MDMRLVPLDTAKIEV